MTAFDWWILAIAFMSAAACAVLGNFLVLRRLSMMGDAISHAVLPGLVMAFVLTSSRNPLPMFIGAAAVGILTALLTQWVNRFGKVDESASMGVVFTSLFALGLVMINLLPGLGRLDIDPECVLYGAIETAALALPGDAWLIGGVLVPPAALNLAIVLAVNLAVVGALYKEFKISSFDPELATSLGIHAGFMHYLLMTLVAVTAVASFEAVGSILVIAMLIVPAAAAHLLTDRLGVMVGLSLVVAAASAIGGFTLATKLPQWTGTLWLETNVAGMMAAVSGVVFAGAMLLSPRYGVISRLAARWSLSTRIATEDALGTLIRREEEQGGRVVLSWRRLIRSAGAGPILSRLALRRLLQRRQVESSPEGLALTDQGRADATDLLRTHRLWETYLVEAAGTRPDHTHSTAEKLEHVTSQEMKSKLREDAPASGQDPHGRPIP